MNEVAGRADRNQDSGAATLRPPGQCRAAWCAASSLDLVRLFGTGADRRLPRVARAADNAKELHTWRVYLVRAKGEFLGTVEAPDEKTAMQVAAEEFKLTPMQAARLLVQRAG